MKSSTCKIIFTLGAPIFLSSCLQTTTTGAVSPETVNSSESSVPSSSSSSSAGQSSSASSSSAGTLALGSIAVTHLANSNGNGCPSGYYANGTTVCDSVKVTCPGIPDRTATVSTATPIGTVKGTIFTHAGGYGDRPFNLGPKGTTSTYVDSFFNAGYRVIQIGWTNVVGEEGWENTGGSTDRNIKIAGCRPATLMKKYAFDIKHVSEGGNTGGMCALGFSGGTAAIGYSLAYYGAADYLDSVTLLSGPVFGDVAVGCQVPKAPFVSICPDGQYGCVGDPWSADPSYLGNSSGLLQGFTGDPGCAGTQNTTSSQASRWKAMSVVDGTAQPNFNYPNTALSGWFCDNGKNPSAPQGYLYFKNFTSPSQTAQFSINRVQDCQSTEDIWDGVLQKTKVDAFDASVNDMINNCKNRH